MSDYIAIPYPKRYGYESVRLIKLVRTASDRPLSGDEEIMIAQHNEIATLKEQNALLTVQAQEVVERLQFMFDDECFIESLTLGNGTKYRINWPSLEETQAEWFPSPREAIDAAMSAQD